MSMNPRKRAMPEDRESQSKKAARACRPHDSRAFSGTQRPYLAFEMYDSSLPGIRSKGAYDQDASAQKQVSHLGFGWADLGPGVIGQRSAKRASGLIVVYFPPGSPTIHFIGETLPGVDRDPSPFSFLSFSKCRSLAEHRGRTSARLRARELRVAKGACWAPTSCAT